jgi:hypothetical protein
LLACWVANPMVVGKSSWPVESLALIVGCDRVRGL